MDTRNLGTSRARMPHVASHSRHHAEFHQSGQVHNERSEGRPLSKQASGVPTTTEQSDRREQLRHSVIEYLALEAANACQSGLHWACMLARSICRGILCLRTYTYRGVSYLDAAGISGIIFLVPGWVWWTIKICMVAALGHLACGLFALRWFEQYHHEPLLLFKIIDYEFTVRNSDGYVQDMGDTTLTNIWSRMIGAFEKTNTKYLHTGVEAETPHTSSDVAPTESITGFGVKYQYNIPSGGSFLTRTGTTDTRVSHWRLTSDPFVPVSKVGILFVYDDLLTSFEHLRLLLHIQIVQALLGRIDDLTKSLTTLLAELSPLTVDKHKLQSLAKQIRSMHSPRDLKELGHVWWHERIYPSTLTATDIEELTTWANIVIRDLVTEKHMKLQRKLDGLNGELFKRGIVVKLPRGRRAHTEEAKRQQQEQDKLVAKKQGLPVNPKENGLVTYSGVAGDLMKLPKSGVSKVVGVCLKMRV
ncbi:hypothetical protein BU23DRAFT_567949 [Bimuria novae-zelandiae CBS 107.79]|uniref:Uncharacterized protein n=1 Tax=Bimuria novae-zelandiae CBS 107.79 TaxID=1447943 RepID=A0A6A5VAN2_9PLEO|nr:hypothetical protein BU23DRAFT_567949 [Bimuria novae-zelandiae CBS 107.79]